MKITIIADISTRIARERRNADRITAAAVCLPSGALNHVRRLLPVDLPKWRSANDATAALVANIVRREALGIGVYSVEKSDDKWEQFWDDASTLNADLRGKISHIKAAYQIKCLMFVKSTALACASAINAGNIVRSSSRQFKISTRETFIFDKEIDGVDNIDVFKSIWDRVNAGQPLAEKVGIKRTVEDVQLVTEQEERLLMLPDYIGGIAHAATSQANVLAASQVSSECVRRLQQRFAQAPGYLLVREPFSLSLSEILEGWLPFNVRWAPPMVGEEGDLLMQYQSIHFRSIAKIWRRSVESGKPDRL